MSHFCGWTLDAIPRHNAARFPDRAAVICRGSRLSWRELDQRVDRVAGALAAVGLKPGDRVALLLSNCSEFIELYFGISRAGMIAVPINYRLTPRETATILGSSRPELLVVGQAYQATALALEELMPTLRRRWVVGGPADSYAETLALAPPPIPPAGNEDDPFAIFFTSGTTGLPKGAVVSHRNLEANAFNQCIADASRPSDINLVASPLYHMGAVFMATTYMLLGCTQVILPQFDPPAWFQAVEGEGATVSLLIPTMINSLLNHAELGARDLSRLRLIFYGGGPMPPALLRRALQQLGCGFTQGYGLTETLEATFLTASDHVLDGSETQLRRLASAGREAAGAEVRIVDLAGQDLPANEIGEILVRSHSVISGYWNSPEETAAAIRDGWFYTGDLGYLDEDRYLFLVDRKKDMVVSGGVNIYTKEIEAVLYAHPAVLEAAVIALPDEEWGEVVTAVVVLRPGMTMSAEQVIGHCTEQLASFKKPRVVHFVDELPKNPSGKILKRDLRDLFRGSSPAVS